MRIRFNLFTAVMTTICFAAVVMYFGIGCSDSSSPSGDGGTPDNTPPVVSSVTPVDITHLDVLFDEAVDGVTAQYLGNYMVYKTSPPSAPAHQAESGEYSKIPFAAGDTLEVGSCVLMADNKTISVSLMDNMTDGTAYAVSVKGVADVSGNKMASSQSTPFTGTDMADNTPPSITMRIPAAAATGVGIAQSVEVHFSEPMDWLSLFDAFSWTGTSGAVPFTLEQWSANLYIFTPTIALSANTIYNVDFAANTATDMSNNFLPQANWSYTTTPTSDTIPPTVVSVSPSNGQLNVSTTANLIITYSEAMAPGSLGDGDAILMTPEPGEGLVTFTHGRTTLNFTPDVPLLDNTSYTVVVVEGDMTDLAGNPLAGSTVVKFSTGPGLPAGGIGGKVSGDENSLDATDPEGAVLLASMVAPEDFDTMDGPPPIGGAASVESDSSYFMANISDGTYYPFGILDSNGDGMLDPFEGGDALGFYGVDFGAGDDSSTPVLVTGGGPLNDIDFPLYDPIAIMGRVTYGGTAHNDSLLYFNFYVGAFAAAGFDPNDPGDPDFAYQGESLIFDPDFSIAEMQGGLAEGSYYVGAYLDTGGDGNYHPAVDPGGWYMVGTTITQISVQDGRDAIGINILLEDPSAGPGPGLAPVTIGGWTKPAASATPEQLKLRKMAEFAKQALEQINTQ